MTVFINGTVNRAINRILIGLALIAVVVSLGACGKRPAARADEPFYFEEMREAIADNIKDFSRAQAMSGELDLMQSILLDARRLAREHGTELRDLMADYNSSPDDFRDLFERMDAESELIRRRVFEAQLRMKVLATKEEWQDIAREQEPALKEQLRTFDRLRRSQVRAANTPNLARLED